MEETAKRIREQAEQVQEAYQTSRRAVTDLARTASEKSRQAATQTDEWVHENPWVALGIVAGVGLLLGLLLSQSIGEDD
jgi:ElaB/YqjD/DUF883 family membrane-anchored ribosome-binding protein